MKNWADFSFIVRSKHRRRVFEALINTKTPSQLSKELKLDKSYLTRLLISLIKRELIECLNPTEKRYKLYTRTKKGNDLYKFFSLPFLIFSFFTHNF